MFEGMDSTEIVFWFCAIGGTTFFVLKTSLMIFAGLDHDLDSGGFDDDITHGSDAAFKLLSLNSLTGFLMMFGWVGLSCYKQAGMNSIASVGIAAIAGLATMYIIAKLFSLIPLLSSPGSEYKIEDTIGCIANVYERIPEDGKGRIQVTVGNLLREVDAISDSGQAIDSFKSVEVLKVINPTTVSVAPKTNS